MSRHTLTRRSLWFALLLVAIGGLVTARVHPLAVGGEPAPADAAAHLIGTDPLTVADAHWEAYQQLRQARQQPLRRSCTEPGGGN